MDTQAHLPYLNNIKNLLNNRSSSGFTLPEILVVVVIIGILAGLVAPSWLAFIDVQRLKTAQNEVHDAMHQARSQAIKEKLSWRFSFREQNGILQWAIHPAIVNSSRAKWNNLDSHVRLDSETTLLQSDGIGKFEFDYRGNVNVYRRITLSSKYGGKAKRCVYVSTLLGTMRTAKEHNQVNREGDYCY